MLLVLYIHDIDMLLINIFFFFFVYFSNYESSRNSFAKIMGQT